MVSRADVVYRPIRVEDVKNMNPTFNQNRDRA